MLLADLPAWTQGIATRNTDVDMFAREILKWHNIMTIRISLKARIYWLAEQLLANPESPGFIERVRC
jgi:hypothetical protein